MSATTFTHLPATRSPGASWRPRWFVAALIATAASALAWFGLPQVATEGRLALMVFAVAIVGWTVLRLPEMPVAVAASAALVLFGAMPAERFYAALGNSLVWLLIAAFILAAVLQASGLAQRYALRAVAGASSIRALFHRLTLVIGATAFVLPSTSGRAALLLPVFLVLASALAQPRLVRALALLFPSAILLTACASMLGAGAHLIAVDFITQLGWTAPGFMDWALLGLPVALASAAAATELVLRLFLTPSEQAAPLQLPPPTHEPLTPAQRRVLTITTMTIAAWTTERWHGVEPAFIALAGAIAATARPLTGVTMKEALKGVEWNLILFLAATLAMGEALLASGAAHWLAEAAVRHMPTALHAQPILLVAVVAIVAMLSHLLITSRSARAAVLIPALALPLAVAPAQATALILLVTMASGFCQTFKVSAKPVALYAGAREGDRPAYTDADLARLALALMPVFALVLGVCALWWWPLTGVDVRLSLPAMQPQE